MITEISYIGLLGLFLSFLYYKIFLIYYQYWYYKRQGCKDVGFPLPFVLNLPHIRKALAGKTEYELGPFEDFYYKTFGKVVPPNFLNFRMNACKLISSDPEFV
jgi:hypothetical protein